MKLFADILIIVVALEPLFIMLLEMFGTQTKLARNVFNLKQKYLLQKEARISMGIKVFIMVFSESQSY